MFLHADMICSRSMQSSSLVFPSITPLAINYSFSSVVQLFQDNIKFQSVYQIQNVHIELYFKFRRVLTHTENYCELIYIYDLLSLVIQIIF